MSFNVPALPSLPGKLTASALRQGGGGMAATAAVAAAARGPYWLGQTHDLSAQARAGPG